MKEDKIIIRNERPAILARREDSRFQPKPVRSIEQP